MDVTPAGGEPVLARDFSAGLSVAHGRFLPCGGWGSRRDAGRGSMTRSFGYHGYFTPNTIIDRLKNVNDKVVESSGEITEGRVDFFDESKKTYGIEYYVEGKKSGPSRTYFADGRSNIEAYYQWGKLLWKREYYNDGGIRLEVNYEDAREQTGNKERGVGRVYYRDGTIKYEWNLTNSEKIGFKKSYNQDGALRAAFYFDEYGQPVE